jgi:tetratricopeptide (TPR) repeat protein
MSIKEVLHRHGRTIALCLGLAAVTWLVFGQTLFHDFVNYDDGTYVYDNPIVTRGLTPHGLGWAFTHEHARNWHPLTTISHMLDVQFFGAHAGGHHFTNVLLHTVAVILLFLILSDMTGAVARSAFIAAVFAIHPLHVESVAWVAERKDVLSAVFFMLTLGAYLRYAREPSLLRYLGTLALFALGLMSKPMLVTVPLVLLLLDYWPLGRISDRYTARQVLLEKIPFFMLSIASSVATLVAQGGTVGALEPLPLFWRMSNALVSCVTYIGQTLWPANLAVFYPHPENHLPIWLIIFSVVFLAAMSVIVIRLRGERPYLLIGWFWYLVMLAPVIGLFQIGLQGHADRYTYLPGIGLYLMLTWTVADLSIFRDRPQVLSVLAGIVIFVFAGCAWIQATFWKDSATLWTHALAVTSNNDVAHTNLGFFFERRGQLDDALAQYQTALQIRSGSGEGRYTMSTAIIHTNIGNALSGKGRFVEAISEYQKAIELRPDYTSARYNLGNVLLHQGKVDDAIAEWNTALSIQPDDAQTHTSLANAYLQRGSIRDAIDHYEKAIKAPVPSIFALNNLAWILSTCPDASVRDGAKAVALAGKAVQVSRIKSPIFVRTLAAAYAETGRFDEAIRTARRALQLARDQNDTDLANEIETDIGLYRDHTPLRDPTLTHAHT